MSSTSRSRALMRTSSLRASSGSALTRSRNAWRSISSASTGAAARTVALRGRPSSTPISPTNSPAWTVPSTMASLPTLAQDIGAAREDQDRQVAGIALPEQDLICFEPLAHRSCTPDFRNATAGLPAHR